MDPSCRSWWRNCALSVDDEIRGVDRLEDEISPVSAEVSKVRELISSFEVCHHKAERWARNILEAIGAGTTTKGLGSRPPGRLHPAERTWQEACDSLSDWCAGRLDPCSRAFIGTMPAGRLLGGLGDRSPLKEWQVRRVIERIRSLIHWPRHDDDPATRYEWILLDCGDDGVAYRQECPDRYRDHPDFWRATVRTRIHDTEQGQESELPLGLAIDMLWPCHWNFLGNLQVALDAIGGRLFPQTPFQACGRNIARVPGQERWGRLAASLRAFCGRPGDGDPDQAVLAALGTPTPTRRWLAASFEKTIRLQLHPPADVRKASALAGPYPV